MAEFALFSDFAPEIRRMIWRHALEEESSSRMVLVHHDSLRIIPSKSLRSSLMLASHESRLCTKEFYNVQVDVYAMPPLIVPEDDSYEAMCSRIWPNEDEDREHKNWERMAYYWWEHGQISSLQAAKDMLSREPDLTVDQLKGSLSLSTEWDRFVISPEFELVPDHESPCLGSMAPFGRKSDSIFASPILRSKCSTSSWAQTRVARGQRSIAKDSGTMLLAR
ncbi:hypothetical protein PG984_014897 [Apiospora sp. TS-2023a]